MPYIKKTKKDKTSQNRSKKTIEFLKERPGIIARWGTIAVFIITLLLVSMTLLFIDNGDFFLKFLPKNTL